jgi:hypothetical protein
LLRFIPRELRHDALLAFEEVVQRGPEVVRQELGPAVEDTSPLKELLEAIKGNDQAIEAARVLLDYLMERGQFLDSDASRLLDEVFTEVSHQTRKKPGILRGYPRTAAFFEAKRRLISEGIARARETKRKNEASG